MSDPIKEFKSKRNKSYIKGILYQQASREAERLGEVNKAKNLKYKARAEFNEVTDLGSLLDEIKYRWKSNPWLGGEPEEGTIWYYLQYPTTPVKPVIYKKYNQK